MWENKCDLKSSSDKERRELMSNISKLFMSHFTKSWCWNLFTELPIVQRRGFLSRKAPACVQWVPWAGNAGLAGTGSSASLAQCAGPAQGRGMEVMVSCAWRGRVLSRQRITAEFLNKFVRLWNAHPAVPPCPGTEHMWKIFSFKYPVLALLVAGLVFTGAFAWLDL